MDQARRKVQGVIQAANGAADATAIAAPGADKRLRIAKAIVQVTVAASGGGGEVALEDGLNGTRIFVADADAVGTHVVDFGNSNSESGYDLAENTLLNLTVDGAVTTQATARVTAIGYIL